MKDFIKTYWKFLFFGVIGLFLFISMGVMHEQAHVEIYKSYGVESHIDLFGNFPHVSTVAEEPCPDSSCELAHNINEVVTCTLEPFYIMIYFGILFLLTRRKNE